MSVHTSMRERAPGSLAPRRLRTVRIAVALGVYAVLLVEALSLFDALQRWAVALCWLPWLAVAGALLSRRRWSPAASIAGARAAWQRLGRVDRAGWVVLAILLLTQLVVALLAEPNNFDSQTYHLPRIEHWVADGNVAFYPTANHRQASLAPGAEELLVHVRLLSGGDQFLNLLQFSAELGGLIAATRIVVQLGGGARAQLITALLVGTTPMVVLQATSTQNDLVVAGWTACLATLLIDALRRGARIEDALLLGAATGLIAVTKTTGLLAAGPLLVIWGVAQVRLASRRPARLAAAAGAGAGILAVAALLAAPYYTRLIVEFGSPLGPPQLRGSIPTQRHDPGAVLINALRIGQTALDTPAAPLRTATDTATQNLADAIGVDLNDPAITFVGDPFPVAAWYPDEDRVSFPISGTLALLAWSVALIRPRRLCPSSPGLIRWYSCGLGVAGLLYVATVKWQSSGNRLLLFLLILTLPIAGVGLERASLRRRGGLLGRPSIASTCVLVILTASVLSGVLTVAYGFPRRLLGTGSVFTTSPDETRFLRRPSWLVDYRWAAEKVEAMGAARVGIVESNNDWEYPWWLLLRDGRQIVSLTSVLPRHPAPAATTVDVIVCTAAEQKCRSLVPPGWTYERHGVVALAAPE